MSFDGANIEKPELDTPNTFGRYRPGFCWLSIGPDGPEKALKMLRSAVRSTGSAVVVSVSISQVNVANWSAISEFRFQAQLMCSRR